jgi:nitroreductase
MYRWGLFNSMALVKFPLTFFPGLFRPMMRPALTKRSVQEVAVKSAALAAENFMLAVAAQGGATCPMEGFDEWRLKRYLKLSCSARIVMVISIGYAAEKGLWGPQFRLPLEEVVHLR